MNSPVSQKFHGTTASRTTQVLGVASMLGLALVTLLGLVATGEDQDQQSH